ncbi:hypothetical protein [Hymenobacter ruricola]|uniref:ABC transmembrane type-1 domain-containing protein n=1 Tax=Hymenobacter ruricola TaxID=2791023 RepID=A0ABS0I6U9_9BACT|nr:hypothetical protein [Hymenobacter ruricola]MBF9222683.1 hypothetical protein [Hymenobacter ruricola]
MAAPASKPFLVRELLWLLVILVAAVPLAMLLYTLIDHATSPEQSTTLKDGLQSLLGTELAVEVALYVLAVLSCYMGRLGTAAAARLAQAIPQETRRPRPA